MSTIHRLTKLFSTMANPKKGYGSATLYFWEPNLHGRPIKHPALSYLLKGDVGHLSLEFQKNDASVKHYFSVWPTPDSTDHNIEGQPIKKATLAESLNKDLEQYPDQKPQIKKTDINQTEYEGLKLFVETYQKTTKAGGAIDGGEIWAIKSNCADAVYEALRSANLISDLSAKILPRTPKKIFKLGFDTQEILLSNRQHP